MPPAGGRRRPAGRARTSVAPAGRRRPSVVTNRAKGVPVRCWYAVLMRRHSLAVSVFTVVLFISCAFATKIAIEDWTAQPLGVRGIPAGWTAYATPGGRPAYDFSVVE